jgi:UDP-N-acetylmuramate dehydrogenase
LAGLGFAVAIPASLGGAVRMNAGAHRACMGDVVEQVEVHRLVRGGRVTVPAAQIGFAYRHTRLPDDAVILAATVALAPGDPVSIRREMDEARRWRRETQPIAEANCGSVFTNPPGDHAARLIDGAGLKGRRVGGAHVSRKHANFIVADPGATSADVVRLIEVVRAEVAESTGVLLETEVKIVGAGG